MGPLISEDYLKGEARRCSFCVDELSRRLGLCPRQLNRLFKRHLATPPKRWMLILRIQDATHLLSEGENIKTISLKLKYFQSSHFIRDYKKVRGNSPLKERKCGSCDQGPNIVGASITDPECE